MSLGYFQPYGDRGRHAASLGCPVVRRISGGGAILHDAELTYSIAVPRHHRLATRRLALYQAVHAALIEVLSGRGIEASLCEGHEPTTPRGRPFLCFQRRAPGDVLIGRIKIAGSAQRRSAGAVLQHGSVLLARCSAAPELDGLNDLEGRPVRHDELIDAWREALARRLGLAWQDQPLTDAERRRVAALVETKYGSDRWTIHRGR